MRNYVYLLDRRLGAHPLNHSPEFSVTFSSWLKVRGHQVWVITAEPSSPTRFYLTARFIVDSVQSLDGEFVASGAEGETFDRPPELTKEAWFRKLNRNTSANWTLVAIRKPEYQEGLTRALASISTETSLSRATQQQAATARSDGVLRALEPLEHHRVMDLVAAAGLDTTGWSNFAGGASKASQNPKYCYDWSFEQANRAVVVNLWHRQMVAADGEVSVALTLRDRDVFKGIRRRRAEKLLGAIARADIARIPIRVIVNAGTITQSAEDSRSTGTRVEKRLLDPMPWHVARCDMLAGSCLLRRGPAPGTTLDQFLLDPLTIEVARREKNVSAFVRNPTFRRHALDRARGRCEHCGVNGFVLPSGELYLETHHVVPLCEGGLDSISNIIAICPNDHREAHIGVRAGALRAAMLRYLQGEAAQKAG